MQGGGCNRFGPNHSPTVLDLLLLYNYVNIGSVRMVNASICIRHVDWPNHVHAMKGFIVFSSIKEKFGNTTGNVSFKVCWSGTLFLFVRVI